MSARGYALNSVQLFFFPLTIDFVRVVQQSEASPNGMYYHSYTYEDEFTDEPFADNMATPDHSANGSQLAGYPKTCFALYDFQVNDVLENENIFEHQKI